jgi:hypothetical protein
MTEKVDDNTDIIVENQSASGKLIAEAKKTKHIPFLSVFTDAINTYTTIDEKITFAERVAQEILAGATDKDLDARTRLEYIKVAVATAVQVDKMPQDVAQDSLRAVMEGLGAAILNNSARPQQIKQPREVFDA